MVSQVNNDYTITRAYQLSVFPNLGPEAGPNGTGVANGHLNSVIPDFFGIHLHLDTTLKETPKVP
jgi:hypothetical protein